MTGEATAAKESTGGRREQCNIVAMPETSPASKTSTCHKTVRSGTIYDFDMQERRRESLERAEKLKAELGDEPITGTDDRIAYRFVKRIFDFVFSAAVLVLLSWLFVIIAILVKVDDPKGPVFFKQTRVGKNGREFEMLKFRSMCVDAEEKLADLKELNEKTGPVFKIAEDPRITRVGKWLRKLSLDELPQFINVLRSDIPLRILKMRPEFSVKRMGVFALPAKSSTNIEEVFSQVASCFASGLRMRRISGFDCNRIGGMETQFLAKPVFGVSPVHTGALFRKSNNGLAEAAWQLIAIKQLEAVGRKWNQLSVRFPLMRRCSILTTLVFMRANIRMRPRRNLI